MDRVYEAKYHVQENTNWWFESRRDMIFHLLKRENGNSMVLDIGCSGGTLIEGLKRRGFKNIYGIDISANAIDLCRRKGIENVFVMDGTRSEFSDAQFDIIIASDLLEHIEREGMALCEWKRILKPGGKLIVFVPAFNFLWGKHDAANYHYRRYSKSRLTFVLEKAEFKVDRCSYWNFTLFFPTSLVRIFQRTVLKGENRKGDQLLELNRVANKLLLCLVRIENIILKLVDFPIGVSVFAIARKDKTAR